MARGLSQSAKYGRTVLWLDRQEKLCRTFPHAIVRRNGRTGNVTVWNELRSHTTGVKMFSSIYVSLSWGNASNGESFGLPTINGRFPGWGDWEKQLRDAYESL